MTGPPPEASEKCVVKTGYLRNSKGAGQGRATHRTPPSLVCRQWPHLAAKPTRAAG